MRQYPVDKDCEAIVVELVSAGCDTEGVDGPSWVWVLWSLIDVRNEVIYTPKNHITCTIRNKNDAQPAESILKHSQRPWPPSAPSTTQVQGLIRAEMSK